MPLLIRASRPIDNVAECSINYRRLLISLKRDALMMMISIDSQSCVKCGRYFYLLFVILRCCSFE